MTGGCLQRKRPRTSALPNMHAARMGRSLFANECSFCASPGPPRRDRIFIRGLLEREPAQVTKDAINDTCRGEQATCTHTRTRVRRAVYPLSQNGRPEVRGIIYLFYFFFACGMLLIKRRKYPVAHKFIQRRKLGTGLPQTLQLLRPVSWLGRSCPVQGQIRKPACGLA